MRQPRLPSCQWPAASGGSDSACWASGRACSAKVARAPPTLALAAASRPPRWLPWPLGRQVRPQWQLAMWTRMVLQWRVPGWRHWPLPWQHGRQPSVTLPSTAGVTLRAAMFQVMAGAGPHLGPAARLRAASSWVRPCARAPGVRRPTAEPQWVIPLAAVRCCRLVETTGRPAAAKAAMHPAEHGVGLPALVTPPVKARSLARGYASGLLMLTTLQAATSTSTWQARPRKAPHRRPADTSSPSLVRNRAAPRPARRAAVTRAPTLAIGGPRRGQALRPPSRCATAPGRALWRASAPSLQRPPWRHWRRRRCPRCPCVARAAGCRHAGWLAAARWGPRGCVCCSRWSTRLASARTTAGRPPRPPTRAFPAAPRLEGRQRWDHMGSGVAPRQWQTNLAGAPALPLT